MEYVNRVKEVHSRGGYGSIGYGYDWKIEEAEKLILRTHTTSVSSNMLYRLAQETKANGVFKPAKFFSIDRVYRNETVDATHLAEFHQVEGVIADKNLTLGDLIGFMEVFFEKMGVPNIKFKPAFNPYTEPSMEIFSWHPGLEKWVELGNSGMFRPEMLEAMGLDPDVRVIAWGLGLERPTMIKYGLDNIREVTTIHRSLWIVVTHCISTVGDCCSGVLCLTSFVPHCIASIAFGTQGRSGHDSIQSCLQTGQEDGQGIGWQGCCHCLDIARICLDPRIVNTIHLFKGQYGCFRMVVDILEST